MKAFLKNYRQTPRKVRLVADSVRGKGVVEAGSALSFLDNKAASAVKKLIDSAISNAGTDVERKSLFVKKITVDEGMKMKRYMPKSRGRATPFKRRASRITLELGKQENESM